MKERLKVAMQDWIFKKVKKENENAGLCKNNILLKKNIMTLTCFDFIKCVIIDILTHNILPREHSNSTRLKCS